MVKISLFVLLMLTSISIHCYGRNVDIIIKQEEKRICIVDSYQPEKDTSMYEYVKPEGLRVFIITYSDTQCVFLSPCVAEYDKQNDRNCIVYLWTSRIICPDDCVCLNEGESRGGNRNITDAEIFLIIKMDDDSVCFTFAPQIDLMKTASEYSFSLFAEIKAQKREGTLPSAFFWRNVYETIIHNDMMFYLFSQKLLQINDVKLLSSQLKHFDYVSENIN